MTKKKKDPLKIIGMAIIVISAIILFSAFPLIQQTVFNFGPLKTDISPISATRLTIGIVGIFMGLVVYFGKEGLKIFMKK
ncbi:hypothetical protein KAR52_00160 [Candidatus Pacearchaeota archaeon]|nr:hypothetical protein [Candidatus Pacearchaeota archaeon]